MTAVSPSSLWLLKAGFTCATAAALVAPATCVGAADAVAWQVVGKQGLLLQVIVPTAQARDRAAYLAQVPALCGDRETCFVNFYTNSTGAALATPLPDAVFQEATAVFRRSEKHAAEQFRWACRLALDPGACHHAH